MLLWVRRAVWQASWHAAGAAEGTGASTLVFHSPVAGLAVARVALPCLAAAASPGQAWVGGHAHLGSCLLFCALRWGLLSIHVLLCWDHGLKRVVAEDKTNFCWFFN